MLLAVSSWWMSGWNLEVTAGPVFWTGLMQGLGAGSIIGPLGLLTFASLSAEHRTEAASMWNLIRSLGSSIGIATALAILVRTAGISHGVLAAISYNDMLRQQALPGGNELTDPSALVELEGEVARQALMIGYVDVFYLCAITSVLAMPLIPLLRTARVPSDRNSLARLWPEARIWTSLPGCKPCPQCISRTLKPWRPRDVSGPCDRGDPCRLVAFVARRIPRIAWTRIEAVCGQNGSRKG